MATPKTAPIAMPAIAPPDKPEFDEPAEATPVEDVEEATLVEDVGGESKPVEWVEVGVVVELVAGADEHAAASGMVTPLELHTCFAKLIMPGRTRQRILVEA